MKKCAHCGRTGRVAGALHLGDRRYDLCHAMPDGRKCEPDCYHLVTTHQEVLGDRIGNDATNDRAAGHED